MIGRAALGVALALLAAPPLSPEALSNLVRRSRARPKAPIVATRGVVSTQHFVSGAGQAADGFRLTRVAHRGTPAAPIALRNQEVQMVAEIASIVPGQIRGGEVRGLNGNARLRARPTDLGLTPREAGNSPNTIALVQAENTRWTDVVGRTGMGRRWRVLV